MRAAGRSASGALKPNALFGLELEPAHPWRRVEPGVNILAFVLVSLARRPAPIERLQASDLRARRQPDALLRGGFRLARRASPSRNCAGTVGRYLGEERTERSFQDFEARNRDASPAEEATSIRTCCAFAEHLARHRAIGAPPRGSCCRSCCGARNCRTKPRSKLLDDASAAIQYNRDLLQHALDQPRQGITVFDRDLRLIAGTGSFRNLFELPDDWAGVGVGLDEIVRYNASARPTAQPSVNSGDRARTFRQR